MAKIKICGLFRDADIGYVNEFLPDYIGFVFARSRRQVTPDQAEKLAAQADRRMKRVGVFVNADVEELAALAQRGFLDLLQLHGTEDNAYIRRLKAHTGLPVIKAVQVASQADIEAADRLDCDYLLLDSGKGSGRTFDWSLIRRVEKPFFLAGGLSRENVARAVRELRPYGVDLSSGAETDGVKDREKIGDIIRRVRNV